MLYHWDDDDDVSGGHMQFYFFTTDKVLMVGQEVTISV